MSLKNDILCTIFGHKYRTVRAFSLEVQKLPRKRCKKQFGMQNNVQALAPWDYEIEEATKIAYPD
jgi:hypothetical protein